MRGSGSIPAWTGETVRVSPMRQLIQVYPRVDGGNGVRIAAPDGVDGLSPRGRGKHTDEGTAAYRRRSIPAWTGETVMGILLDTDAEVYPRVDGGNSGRYSLT